MKLELSSITILVSDRSQITKDGDMNTDILDYEWEFREPNPEVEVTAYLDLPNIYILKSTWFIRKLG